MPFVLWSWSKKRALFWGYTTIAFLSSILFIFWPSLVHFKLVMWLPWSVVVVATLWWARHEQDRRFILMFCVMSLVVFLGTFLVEKSIGHSLTQYDNKYPPNLYHLSYGLFCVVVLYYLSQRGVFEKLRSTSFLSFLSRYSYSIYFIHFLFIYVFLNFFKSTIYAWGWPLYFVVLLGLTLVTQWGFNTLKRLSASRH